MTKKVGRATKRPRPAKPASDAAAPVSGSNQDAMPAVVGPDQEFETSQPYRQPSEESYATPPEAPAERAPGAKPQARSPRPKAK